MNSRDKLPRHIAIVMDGNRRWAKERHLPSLEGHRQGVKAVRRALEACLDLGIETLTLYAFSTENWKRSPGEVSALLDLLAYHLKSEMAELVKEGVQFHALGRIHQMSPLIQKLVRELEQETAGNTRMVFNLALNYGGRQELADAAREVAREVARGRLDPERVDEAVVAAHLTTAGQVDPDLLIRTSGEQRLSNFLLWQLAYTELVFLPIFWPDFDVTHLQAAIEEFGRRERRFGATN